MSTALGTNPINSVESRAGAPVQAAERLRVHTRLVIGGRDLPGAKPKAEVVADNLAVIPQSLY